MSWSNKDVPDLNGKVAIVTGGNGGMGFAVAKMMASKGAHIIIAARSRERVQAAVESILSSSSGSKVEGMLLDLASMRSVETFAAEFLAKDLPLHILVNNAAIFMPPFAKTPEGIEVTAGANHFNTYYLTQLLLPKLKASAPARIVFVSSGAAEMASEVDWSDLKNTKATSSGLMQYSASKQYSALLSKALGKELEGSNIDVTLIDPGMAFTGIQRKGVGLLARLFYLLAALLGQTGEQGAVHITFGATAPGLEGKGFTAWTPKYKMWGKTIVWSPPIKGYKDDVQCQRMLADTRQILQGLAPTS